MSIIPGWRDVIPCLVYRVLLGALIALPIGCVLTVPAGAGDWPQILGPNRNGVASGEKLLSRWPSSGPMMLWKSDVGSGFAGVAVQNEKVIVFFRDGDQEIVRMLDAKTGATLWSSPAPCRYRGGVSSDKGPRCVPLIHQDRVYVFGVEGLLRCLSMKDGAEIWKRDTEADFQPLEGYFGAGSTPVLHGDLLLVNVGGRTNSAVVAFDRASGRTVWTAFDDSASYSSPIVANVGGVDHALVVTRLNLISLNPASGELRFSLPFGARGPTVNGATPVLLGDPSISSADVMVSSSYRIGSLVVRLKGPTGTEFRRDQQLLATQYATPIVVGDRVFAVDGRQDEGPGAASLKCIDPLAGKVIWQQDGFDYGSLLLVGDQLLFLTCGGDLIRFDASAEEYVERQRVRVLNSTESGYRLPALSNGRLFVRDDATLKCLVVGEN